MQFAPLPVVTPLIVAAAMAAGSGFLHRRVLDLAALATSAAVLVINLHLTLVSSKGVIVYWFGGWQPAPHSHFPIGICFMIDPFGAGLAALVSLLVLAAFTFSWSYFESVKALYHTVMLVFLAAMCGLCLTGDLFNLFVWFELMTAAGVALCGYKSEESQSRRSGQNPSEFLPPQRPAAIHEESTPSTWWTRIVVFVGMLSLALLGIFPREKSSIASKVLYRVIAYPLLRLRPLQVVASGIMWPGWRSASPRMEECFCSSANTFWERDPVFVV